MGVRNSISTPEIKGAQEGDLLVLGWGSTYGAIADACMAALVEPIALLEERRGPLRGLPDLAEALIDLLPVLRLVEGRVADLDSLVEAATLAFLNAINRVDRSLRIPLLKGRSPPAGVPGRGENGNTCKPDSSHSSDRRAVLRNDSSDSVGNPTITSVVIPLSGNRSRTRRTMAA